MSSERISKYLGLPLLVTHVEKGKSPDLNALLKRASDEGPVHLYPVDWKQVINDAKEASESEYKWLKPGRRLMDADVDEALKANKLKGYEGLREAGYSALQTRPPYMISVACEEAEGALPEEVEWLEEFVDRSSCLKPALILFVVCQ
jgi:hypothetical protein